MWVKRSIMPELRRTEAVQVNLTDAAHVRSGAYSGGMKRRLSVAMALLGDPAIVFLDEPTTGMDPVSRRQVRLSIQPLTRPVELGADATPPSAVLRPVPLFNLNLHRLCQDLPRSARLAVHNSDTMFVRPHDRACDEQVWDIIEKAKQGRAIVLTTHSMEEADILGDRVAIMAKGSLRCLGSSLRLKQKFGAGYQVCVCALLLASAQRVSIGLLDSAASG